jgi:hypothetical protein
MSDTYAPHLTVSVVGQPVSSPCLPPSRRSRNLCTPPRSPTIPSFNRLLNVSRFRITSILRQCRHCGRWKGCYQSGYKMNRLKRRESSRAKQELSRQRSPGGAMSAIASAKGASMVTSRLKIHEMWDAIVLLPQKDYCSGLPPWITRSRSWKKNKHMRWWIV